MSSDGRVTLTHYVNGDMAGTDDYRLTGDETGFVLRVFRAGHAMVYGKRPTNGQLADIISAVVENERAQAARDVERAGQR